MEQVGNQRPIVNRLFERTALLAGAIALLCLIWLSAKVTSGEIAPFDEHARAVIHSAASPGLTGLFQALTRLGSQAAVIGVSICAALILFLKGRRDRAWLILTVMAGAELLELILKTQFHRHRPEPFFDTLLPASYSFPSGHALLSCCCYGTLAAHAGLPARIAAAALIMSIGISRIYLGVHYPSDVIAGYLVAVAWMAVMAVLYGRIATMKS